MTQSAIAGKVIFGDVKSIKYMANIYLNVRENENLNCRLSHLLIHHGKSLTFNYCFLYPLLEHQ